MVSSPMPNPLRRSAHQEESPHVVVYAAKADPPHLLLALRRHFGTQYGSGTSTTSPVVIGDHLDLFVDRHMRYRGDEKTKRIGDVEPNGSFFPPIGVIAPAPAERFDKQLGASPVDLKARLKCPPARNRVKAYLRKYRERIKSLDMTVAECSAAYTVPILVTPKGLRGFVK